MIIKTFISFINENSARRVHPPCSACTHTVPLGYGTLRKVVTGKIPTLYQVPRLTDSDARGARLLDHRKRALRPKHEHWQQGGQLGLGRAVNGRCRRGEVRALVLARTYDAASAELVDAVVVALEE